jgi:anti-sigma regulatory factor (Ser/Thr protein kinase)
MVCEMSTTTQLAMTPLNVNEARCEALFASALQPSDAPTADMVAEAIKCTVRRFGVRDCAGQMAQEFGDHPGAAVTRMSWVRQLASAARAPASPGAHLPGRSRERGIAPAASAARAAAAAVPERWLDGHEPAKRREPKVPETAAFGRRAEIPLDLLTPEQKRAYDLVLSERSQAPVLHSVLAIEALPAAIACARLHARNVLSGWNLPDQADTVELIVSELVTNAVQATMGYDGRPPDSGEGGLPCVHLRLSSDRVFTLIEVQDENQDLPTPTPTPTPTQANPDDESGRGLMLVAALSRRCGWDLSGQGNGKIAWALVGRLPAGAGPLIPGGTI